MNSESIRSIGAILLLHFPFHKIIDLIKSILTESLASFVVLWLVYSLLSQAKPCHRKREADTHISTVFVDCESVQEECAFSGELSLILIALTWPWDSKLNAVMISQVKPLSAFSTRSAVRSSTQNDCFWLPKCSVACASTSVFCSPVCLFFSLFFLKKEKKKRASHWWLQCALRISLGGTLVSTNTLTTSCLCHCCRMKRRITVKHRLTECHKEGVLICLIAFFITVLAVLWVYLNTAAFCKILYEVCVCVCVYTV